MNDRFKFRVWDIRNGEYFKDPNPTPPLNSDGTLGFTYDKADFQKYYIIEQCTGLKDKNGKLIYENDQFYDSNKRLCTVSWHNGAFHNGFGNLLGNFRTDEIEIIGNIHEQAEQKDVK